MKNNDKELQNLKNIASDKTCIGLQLFDHTPECVDGSGFRTRTYNIETHPYPYPYPYQIFDKILYPSFLRTTKLTFTRTPYILLSRT